MNRLASSLDSGKNLLRVLKKDLACRTDLEFFCLPYEQGDAKIFLKTLDPRCHIRLHTMQLFRSACNSALLRYGTENTQVGEVHHLTLRTI